MPAQAGILELRTAGRSNPLLGALHRGFAKGELVADGLAAIEGVRMVEEAVRSGLKIRAIFFREPVGAIAERLFGQISAKAEALRVPLDLFNRAVLTESPQGVAALVTARKSTLDEILAASQPLILAIAGLQDPGNVGTLIRSAEAFGANGVVLLEGTASAYNAKVIRAAAGSLFRLPVISIKFRELLPTLKEKSVRLLAASSHKGEAPESSSMSGSLCLVIGNEGAGIPRDILREADATIAIPHSPKVESLNAAIAGSVLLYEASKVRSGISNESMTQ
jgi:TrmH family RNA methyltransferase